MNRRIAPLFLALLIALPVAAPASAAQPAMFVPAPSTDLDVGPGAANATVDPAAEPVAPLDPSGRFIVMLRDGTDPSAVAEKARKRTGVKADNTFAKALRGFAAKLDPKQKRDLQADPDVLAVVPDELITLTQTTPTGVSRIGGLLNPVAKINGLDQRVDADVAIVDTGIAYHPDLNVAGGYNCSSTDRAAWRDRNHHGTHVAGTVAALDNSIGVVGVAPGARVYGVKILTDSGEGLISWYICGLNWILSQRDPKDATRPLFEAVNMSVTKYGSDDHNCGLTNADMLHRAICRVVAGGITVVAAAANDHHNAALNIPASYDEVITVSALADTDGRPGGLGGNRCYSWGGYDQDDTFADFSNYGADVDIMAPGKCIWSTIPGPSYSYMSGTSMAAPTTTGAVALYKASRPKATPAEVREALRYLGSQNWKTSTDPDSTHEPLLDVSRLGVLGTFALTPGAATGPIAESGTIASIPVTIVRSPTFFERVSLSVSSQPAGWKATVSPSSLMGWTATAGSVSVVVPVGTPNGSYPIVVTGTNQGRTASATVSVHVQADFPTALPPTSELIAGTTLGRTTLPVRVSWGLATDPSNAIAGYEVEASLNGGAWGSKQTRTAAQRSAVYTLALNTVYQFRVRALDAVGNWSAWAVAWSTSRVHPYDDRSSALAFAGAWYERDFTGAWEATTSGATVASAGVSMSFTARSVALVGPVGTQFGKATVAIDGIVVATIDMHAASSVDRKLAFVKTFATRGTHTIAIKPTGAGTNPIFRIDAIVASR